MTGVEILELAERCWVHPQRDGDYLEWLDAEGVERRVRIPGEGPMLADVIRTMVKEVPA